MFTLPHLLALLLFLTTFTPTLSLPASPASAITDAPDDDFHLDDGVVKFLPVAPEEPGTSPNEAGSLGMYPEGNVHTTHRRCTTDGTSPTTENVVSVLNHLATRGPFCVQQKKPGIQCTRMAYQRAVALWICGDYEKWIRCVNASNWMQQLNPLCTQTRFGTQVVSGHVHVWGTKNYDSVQVHVVRNGITPRYVPYW
ncbi:hypothetical protein EX30DRAFT_340756 [Ascodesmis nigricans]|uniref:Secreted protein n=1 Tax=Ascodesmis nigricans TaxID=341454 RepID=A0A4S2MXP0_9PEZI|nr:hypothetical protein EX30DRAFT_340756 [Ascodesmis nigricans]